MLWTLEAEPPHLIEDEEATEPVPDVTADCLVEEDGFYKPVDSYRLFYVRQKRALLCWTRRGVPEWINPLLKEEARSA